MKIKQTGDGVMMVAEGSDDFAKFYARIERGVTDMLIDRISANIADKLAIELEKQVRKGRKLTKKDIDAVVKRALTPKKKGKRKR